MSKLALAVILFVILIKAAFGADICQFKQDEALGGKIASVLTAAKAANDVQLSLQEPWEASAAQYVAELKKEIETFGRNADTKFLVPVTYLQSLDLMSAAAQEYLAADATVMIVSSFKDASDTDLMYAIIKMKAGSQENISSPEQMSAFIVKSLQDRDTFNMEEEFAKPESKAIYLELINKLKKFNAETILSHKGGPKEYKAFGKKAAEIFF